MLWRSLGKGAMTTSRSNLKHRNQLASDMVVSATCFQRMGPVIDEFFFIRPPFRACETFGQVTHPSHIGYLQPGIPKFKKLSGVSGCYQRLHSPRFIHHKMPQCINLLRNPHWFHIINGSRTARMSCLRKNPQKDGLRFCRICICSRTRSPGSSDCWTGMPRHFCSMLWLPRQISDLLLAVSLSLSFLTGSPDLLHLSISRKFGF